jgi:hypothetical protein
MGFLDHKGGTEYPYLKKDVYDALVEAIPKIKGLKIDNKDELGGRLTVKAGVSLMSWGENIPITVTEISPGRTRVDIISTPKTGMYGGGAFDLGKNRANIEKILNETSKILSTKPPVSPPKVTDVKEGDLMERMVKLKNLYDNKLITEEEYNMRKSELLKQL